MEVTPPHPLPNEQIQDAAGQYYRAFEVLEERHNQVGLEGQEPDFYLPLLNAAAITVELYLKSLAARDEYYPDGPSAPQQKRQPVGKVKPWLLYQKHAKAEEHGHKPTRLFDGIDGPIQKQLTAAFSASSLAQQVGGSFKGFLERYDELFQYSRYAFEEKLHGANFPLDPLFALVRFLHSFVEGLPPTVRGEPKGL